MLLNFALDKNILIAILNGQIFGIIRKIMTFRAESSRRIFQNEAPLSVTLIVYDMMKNVM